MDKARLEEEMKYMDSMIDILHIAYRHDDEELRKTFRKIAMLDKPYKEAMWEYREQFVRLFAPALMEMAKLSPELKDRLDAMLLK